MTLSFPYPRRRYEDAINHFSLAILEDPLDHVFYSNRSACFASLKDFKRALKARALPSLKLRRPQSPRSMQGNLGPDETRPRGLPATIRS